MAANVISDASHRCCKMAESYIHWLHNTTDGFFSRHLYWRHSGSFSGNSFRNGFHRDVSLPSFCQEIWWVLFSAHFRKIMSLVCFFSVGWSHLSCQELSLGDIICNSDGSIPSDGWVTKRRGSYDAEQKPNRKRRSPKQKSHHLAKLGMKWPSAWHIIWPLVTIM